MAAVENCVAEPRGSDETLGGQDHADPIAWRFERLKHRLRGIRGAGQFKTMAKTVPEGWHTVTSRIVVRDPEKCVGFLREVFGAVGDFQADRPAEMRLGDSVVMVSGDKQRDPMPAFLYVYVVDVDATYQRALAAGAVSLEEPTEMPYGDRRGMVRDEWGNTWQIATYRQPVR